ncbi:MAG: urea ABC transporter permease subunit UrtB [Alphaproteobacteria bacterium]|nr:urea ABC transporter permease subunit UrtB [Alphaproteobacteria bacterium]
MPYPRRILGQLLLWISLCLSGQAIADAASLDQAIRRLGQGGFDGTEKAIGELLASGDPRVVPILEALAAGSLQVRKADGAIFIARQEGGEARLIDPLTGEVAGAASPGTMERVRMNNRLRRVIEAARGALTLRSPDPAIRRQAADALFRRADPDARVALEAALAAEKDPAIARRMREALAVLTLAGAAEEAARLEAVAVLARRGDRESLAILAPLAARGEGELSRAAEAARQAIEHELRLWEIGQNVWYGVSLGSVLLLAAIGLAITFGVMGVINMAHGEMVMIGAYTTFVVQEVIRAHMPGLSDYSLAAALPLAFAVSGLLGIAVERGIIRYLYGRPLETLLATWGLSLVLQQAIRSAFGPTNKEVANPSWMSGAFEVGHLAITWNRLWIVLFALSLFALLMTLLRRSAFGLQMRAVTQNRAMAGSMGIRTPMVDALTFGLGSGIAGIAGVALSQIDNVSPNLGQGYIIDSFMVVVFGGVGNLWGTLVGALTLGIVNKMVEPHAGAVLGKIMVLVFIILFIQKRPRGLFALKGRAFET